MSDAHSVQFRYRWERTSGESASDAKQSNCEFRLLLRGNTLIIWRGVCRGWSMVRAMYSNHPNWRLELCALTTQPSRSDFPSAVESGASALINHISGVCPQIAAAKQRSTAFKATELHNDNPISISPVSPPNHSASEGSKDMQDGSVIVERRKRGPDVWCFRWREAGPDGRRIHRRIVLGTAEDLKT
jgi:hypothetical protein